MDTKQGDLVVFKDNERTFQYGLWLFCYFTTHNQTLYLFGSILVNVMAAYFIPSHPPVKLITYIMKGREGCREKEREREPMGMKYEG